MKDRWVITLVVRDSISSVDQHYARFLEQVDELNKRWERGDVFIPLLLDENFGIDLVWISGPLGEQHEFIDTDSNSVQPTDPT